MKLLAKAIDSVLDWLDRTVTPHVLNPHRTTSPAAREDQ